MVNGKGGETQFAIVDTYVINCRFSIDPLLKPVLIGVNQCQREAYLKNKANLFVPRAVYCVWIPVFTGMTKMNISVNQCKPVSKEGKLKKQSQFARRQIGVRSYFKGGYGNKSPCGTSKTNPIYSFDVLCAAFCENEVEKTNPIYSY
jgi:hypothetical protein